MFITPILPETATIHDQALNKMIYAVSLAEFEYNPVAAREVFTP